MSIKTSRHKIVTPYIPGDFEPKMSSCDSQLLIATSQKIFRILQKHRKKFKKTSGKKDGLIGHDCAGATLVSWNGNI